MKEDNSNKIETKQKILNRLMELKAEDRMNRFVFENLAKNNPKDTRIGEVLDWANAIKKERDIGGCIREVRKTLIVQGGR